MIVCGWSAEWDEALRNALIRAPYRRFSTYWASRGIPGTAAQDLIHRKAAHIISIEGADSFFAKLRELVTALESFSQPHPLSTDAAVASLKKYLSEPKYRIQLDDLVSVEVDRAIESVAGPAFDVNEHPVDTTTLSNRVRRYEAVSSTLVAMSLVAGYWATGDQVKPWKRAIVRLAQRKMNGVVSWLDLQRYPACLLTYAFGLGAIASENLAALSTILSTSIAHEHREDISVVKALSPISMFENGTGLMKLLPGKQQHHLPLNSWIEDLFAPISANFFQNEREYKFALDRLEFLWSLAYAHMQRQQQGHFWVPVGNYIYRGESLAKNMALIRSSLTELGEKSPYVTSSIFGATVKECEEILEKIDSFIRTLSRY